jgi:hypothetical protein
MRPLPQCRTIQGKALREAYFDAFFWEGKEKEEK